MHDLGHRPPPTPPCLGMTLAIFFYHTFHDPTGLLLSHLLTCLVRRSGGVLSPTPRINLDVKGGTAPRFVTVRRAPEPSDVRWENARSGPATILRRRLASWSAYAILLVISFIVQFVLAMLAERERGKQRREVETAISAGMGEVCLHAL